MSDDIGHILDSWRFDPDEELAVRIIDTTGGPKLQMRIDLGIMQMELDGNPSHETPMGFESWYDFYRNEQRLVEANNVDDYFTLNDHDCRKIRHEAIHYYYRYLGLMKLGDYPRVIRDTARNLDVFQFVQKYAESDMDRWALDQYRPYVIMMNTRAQASLAVEKDMLHGPEEAVRILNAGISDIINFYREYGLDDDMEESKELNMVKLLRNELVKDIPDISQSLESQLQKAILDERFEDAAELRDRINKRGEGK